MRLAALPDPCRIGTLGSPLTFAGQATDTLVAERAGYGEPTYLPTMDDVVSAILAGSIDVGVLTSETSNTATTDTVARILAGDPLFISDEIVLPYHCALLGKPGTRLDDIRHVGGHGSIRQCRPYLRDRLPQAQVAIHRENSVQAAREVLEGDGTRAVIGTLAAARALDLEVLDTDIDRGSSAGWWALTDRLTVAPRSNLVAMKVEGGPSLTSLLDWARRTGHRVRTITNAPIGQLFEYRYLVVLHTPGDTEVDISALEPHWSDLVGVFSSVTVS